MKTHQSWSGELSRWIFEQAIHIDQPDLSPHTNLYINEYSYNLPTHVLGLVFVSWFHECFRVKPEIHRMQHHYHTHIGWPIRSVPITRTFQHICYKSSKSLAAHPSPYYITSTRHLSLGWLQSRNTVYFAHWIWGLEISSVKLSFHQEWSC